MSDLKKKVLWIGDSPHHNSDFGRITREICHHLHQKVDLKVLGLYNSSYVDLGYPVIDALEAGTGDLGMQKTVHLINSWKPDYVIILNGPIMIGQYSSLIHQNCTHQTVVYTEEQRKENPKLPESVIKRISDTKVIGYICLGHGLLREDLVTLLNNTLDAGIVPTKFASNQLSSNGFTKPLTQIGFGFNQDNFTPIPKVDARKILGISENAFVIYSGYRNQSEKRLDILIRAYVEFLKKHPSEPIVLLMNCGVVDAGWDIPRLYQTLAKRSGIDDWDQHLKLTVAQNDHPMFDDKTLSLFYSASDVGACASHGEFWGFPSVQSAGFGCPQIVPNFSASGELFCKGGIRINPSDFYVEPVITNVAMGLGRIIRATDLCQGLEIYYTNRSQLKKDASQAVEMVRKMSWSKSVELLEGTLN